MVVAGTDASLTVASRADARRRLLVVCGLTAILFLLLFLNRQLFKAFPLVWPIAPLAVCAILWRSAIAEAERTAVTLWRLIGAVSAFVALIRYPLMPIAPDIDHSVAAYGLLVAGWIVAVGCGVGCFRRPGLSVIPPAYLVWSKSFSVVVTGLPNWMTVDLMPLLETSMCIGLGLVTIRLARLVGRGRIDGPLDDFGRLIPLLAIAVHLANYFWSGVAKLTLKGPPLAWLENNPANIFLAALQDKHIAFAGYPAAVEAVHRGLDATRRFSSAFVLAAQLATILGFVFGKRWLILLLLALDAMHLGILVAAGANFWQWIALNVVITIVVARHDPGRLPAAHRALATLLIVCAPWLVSTMRLGWFDSGANNAVSIEAIDRTGQRHPVSANFFAFYSYPIAHMAYGAPERKTALATGAPNGGVQSFTQFQAAQRCDIPEIQKEGYGPRALDPRLLTFLRDYHRLAILAQDLFGGIPASLYPHHFYMPLSHGAEFARIDKREIIAYVVVRESACLSYDGGLKQVLVSTGEQGVRVP